MSVVNDVHAKLQTLFSQWTDRNMNILGLLFFLHICDRLAVASSIFCYAMQQLTEVLLMNLACQLLTILLFLLAIVICFYAQ